MHRIISQHSQIDPKRVIRDDTVLEGGAKAGARRGARKIVFFFEISLKKFPAQFERYFESLNRGVPHNRVLRQG